MYTPIINVSSLSFAPVGTLFKILGKGSHRKNVELVPTAAALTDRSFSVHPITYIVKCSNKYRSKRLHECPGLKV